MRFIIDPPVSAFSEPEEIRAWIVQLEAMRTEVADDPVSLDTLEFELERAREWLEDPIDTSPA